MNTVNSADLDLVIPEIILLATALVLLLVARRAQSATWVAGLTVAAAVAAAWTSIWLLEDESQSGFAGMITLDGYSQFFKVLIACALGLTALLSVKRFEIGQDRPAEYHALLLLASTGMMFTASAVDLLVLYLSLELTVLCAYVLVGIAVEKPLSNEAAIKYLLVGSFASALLLYGIALAYGLTGTTQFGDVASVLSANAMSGGQIRTAAVGLVLAGLAFKIAAVPFHAWAPDAYQGARTPVAGFLASASKAAGLAALGRVLLVTFASEARVLSWVLAALAAASIVGGSIMALSQKDMKRLLAYSSIAHAGYALLGFVPGTSQGVSTTMTYAFLYVFMTLGTFGVIAALGPRGETLDGYQGLARQRPGIAALMLLFLLALTGIPPTAGFVAKFVVILSVVRADFVSLAVLAVGCSVITAFVYVRVAVLMYMKEPQDPEPARCPPAISAVLAVAAAVTVLGGILPGTLAQWVAAP